MSNLDEQRILTIYATGIEQVNGYIYLGQVIKAKVTRSTRLGWAAFGRLSYVLINQKIPLHF